MSGEHERVSHPPAASAAVQEFGDQQELERGTGRFASFAVAFAFVSVATGIFTTYGAVLDSSGPAGVWTWPIVVVGQLAVALIFGSLAARIPVTRAMWQAVLASGIRGFLFLIAITLLGGDPAELAKSATPTADVISRVLGPFVGTALLILVVIAIFACGMVILMSGVRLVWAMARDERFPGHRLLHKVSASFSTPAIATGFFFAIGALILAIFALQTNALFSLFSAATLLPAVVYAAVVLLYIIKRKHLPASQGFTLGRFETPIVVIASVWLIFELLMFRDASFAKSWLYVLIMVAIGAVYLVFLPVKRGGAANLAMPDLRWIDQVAPDTHHDARQDLS